jgi:hypothetical protein
MVEEGEVVVGGLGGHSKGSKVVVVAMYPPKRRLTKYLHGATSQKTAFFIAIAVKTSNLTCM